MACAIGHRVGGIGSINAENVAKKCRAQRARGQSSIPIPAQNGIEGR